VTQSNDHRLAVAVAVTLALASFCSAQSFVRQTKARVTAPTAMYWGYAASGESRAETPEELTPGYKPTAQRFDLYAPRRGSVAGSLPVILFISFRAAPMGWDYVGPTCVREGVIYIGPHGAGNSTPSAERIRIALDCLDEVRRNFPTDPDRTYIAGYSGGGNIASRIAMMLPEYFGGLIASNMTVPLPSTAWHRDRMINRLSIASIVGENEVSGLEMSRIHTPFLQTLGVRARCHVLPRRGHSAPPPQTFESAFLWLEQASAERGRNADRRPVLRIQGSVGRKEFATAALDDCKTLLDDAATVRASLGMLADIKRRWPDLPVADEADALLDEYAARSEQPWVEDGRAEQLREAQFLAQAYEAAARVRYGLTKVQRAIYAQHAIGIYTIIARDTKQENESDTALQRIRDLRPIADNIPTKK
jgi:pimeloyl-ACP methyl ester carboxylesterase